MSIANELITRGWTQGVTLERDGRVCLLGAAIRSFGMDEIGTTLIWDQLPATTREVLLDLTGSIDAWGVGGWNDADGRTYDEVLRVAKQADEILEGF